ncbi:MAG: NAD(P)/FAD-dependent oxidoreductase [Anaerolineae bacterium]|jgi:geranylgeranyl reductase family protein
MVYDAIIVGAGPAGASAAYWLGEAGKRVLVLEKKHLPRYKACGGGVPRSVFDRFPFDFAPVIEREVSRVRFRFRDGREVAADLPGQPVAMVMRDQFDAFILKHARADVRDGTEAISLHHDAKGVTVSTRAGETFRARYAIGADGAHSRVAREAGLHQGEPIGLTLEVETPASEALLSEYADTVLFIFGTPTRGYMWIFPKAEHLSVGVGAAGVDVPHMRRSLRREMARLGISIDGSQHRGSALPVYIEHHPLHQGRVVLAGDAAGLVDPLLGEGIRHAIDSGRFAAEAVLADDLRAYTRRVRREIGNDLIWGLRWAALFYDHPWGSFELGVRNPRFLDEFVRLLAGETTYRGMALRAIPNLILGIMQRRPAEVREYGDSEQE